jgi:hypothetical protein
MGCSLGLVLAVFLTFRVAVVAVAVENDLVLVALLFLGVSGGEFSYHCGGLSFSEFKIFLLKN